MCVCNQMDGNTSGQEMEKVLSMEQIRAITWSGRGCYSQVTAVKSGTWTEKWTRITAPSACVSANHP